MPLHTPPTHEPISDAHVIREMPLAHGPGGPVLDPRAGAPLRAGLWLLRKSPAAWIALGFGSGLSPVAPGTVGTLWAWLSFLALSVWLSPVQWIAVLAAGLPLGWWACTRTAQALRTADPGAIVWDEILAFWLILWVISPADWLWQLAAFALFRYFDAAKPGPVRWADRAFKGPAGQRPSWAQGWGILFDDLVAAGCTLLVLAFAQRLMG